MVGTLAIDQREMDGTLKLHSVNPNHYIPKVLNYLPKVLHYQKDFPKDNIVEIKEFFKRARPILEGRKVFVKIIASFKQSSKFLPWFHGKKKELFFVSAIQGCRVDTHTPHMCACVCAFVHCIYDFLRW